MIAKSSTNPLSILMSRLASVSVSLVVSTFLLTVSCAAFSATRFSHQTGKSGRSMVSVNGHMMQSTHEYHQVVYAADGQTLLLRRPDKSTFKQYVRWYDYQTDAQASGLTVNASATYALPEGYIFATTGADTDEKTASLTMGSSERHIACDQSAYFDYIDGMTVSEAVSAVSPLSWSDIQAMTVGESKVVMLANPHKRNGYILGYNGGARGHGRGFANEAAITAALDTIYADDTWHFTLTRTSAGYTLVSMNDSMSPTSSGSSVNWTSAATIFTLTQATTFGSTSDFMSDLNTEYTIRFAISDKYFNAGGGYTAMKYATGTGEWSCWYVYALTGDTPTPRSYSGSFTEPTVSQRLVFDIFPASQMAQRVDTCTGSHWLETIDMIAPTGNSLFIGPEHGFLSSSNYPNYFCDASSPASLAGATWLLNGSDISGQTEISGGHYFKVSSSVAGQRTYTLQALLNGTTYNIARFNVTFMQKTEVGPATSLSKSITSANANLLAEQRFNFLGNDTLCFSGASYYTVPFTPQESNYGFYFGRSDRNSSGNSLRPNRSEYAFISNANEVSWYNGGYLPDNCIYNHSLAGEADSIPGYFLYVDGAETPGQLMNIRFNAELCPGSKMYFSAYVADLSTEGYSYPNLDFTLVGIDDLGNEHTLTTYTTGEFGGPSSNSGTPDDGNATWLHILFPFRFGEEIQYSSYGLRLTNKGKNSSGNDFIIDDVQIFALMPPVTPLQASTSACTDNENGETTAYLRVDYQAIGNTGNTEYYYRWCDDQMNVLRTDYYGGQKTYGRIKATDTPEASEIYANILAFDNAFHSADHAGYGYIYEDCGDSSRYVLYIAQPLSLQVNRYYTGSVSSSLQGLQTLDICGNSATIRLIGGTDISVNGIRISSHHLDYCGNRQYALYIEMNVVQQSDSTLEERHYDCTADWLYGDSTSVNANPGLYTADWATVSAAIMAHAIGTATAAQQALLTQLVQLGLLTLNSSSITIRPITQGVSTASYTAFPVAGSIGDGSQSVVICTDPRTVDFIFPSDDIDAIVIGTESEILPAIVAAQPRRIRLSEQHKNEGSVTVSVYTIGDPRRTWSIEDAVMCGSTYADWQSLPQTMSVSPAVVSSETDSLTVSGEGLSGLVAGYDYTFYLNAGDRIVDCRDAVTYFTLRIVPDRVNWQPTEVGGAWDDDNNWDTFAPTSGTDVVVATGDHIILDKVNHFRPQEGDTLQAVPLESNALAYISFDINYEPLSCRNIYVPVQTALVGQEHLAVHGQLFFDLQATGYQWTMCALPIQGIRTGDIFTPVNESTDPFAVKPIDQTVGTDALDRTANKYYISLYNSEASIVGSGTDITSTSWTAGSNDLTIEYATGRGIAIGADFEDNAVIRLPKADDFYRYYRYGAWVNDYATTITRDANYGKPAFTATEEEDMALTLHNNSASDIFLLGNPTLGYLDLERLIAGNADLLSGEYYASGINPAAGYDHSQSVAGISADGKDHSLLPPGRAILLKASESATDLTLTLSPSMLTSSEGLTPDDCEDATTTTGNAQSPRRQAAGSNGKHAIYISARNGSLSDNAGYVSYAALVENSEASDSILSGEDSEVCLLDGARTRFAIYTQVSGKALAINQFDSMQSVPLCLYALNSTPSEVVCFQGEETYLSEWDLVCIADGSHTTLHDSLALQLTLPQDGSCAYVLEHSHGATVPDSSITTGETDCTDSSLRASGTNGSLTVITDSTLGDTRIYDAAGHVCISKCIKASAAAFSLPAGLYIVRAAGQTARAIVD